MAKKRVVIICTGNCCRSPMAEGIWRHLAGNDWEVYSAGSSPAGYVHPLTIKILTENKIDTANLTSNSLGDLPIDHFDLAVTLCDNAKACLPVLPADKIEHWPTPDPINASGTDDEQMQTYREVYNSLFEKISEYIEKK